ncbi:VanZ family protein [Evansella sp. AB-rgal1]|uniref:VanZ family protein n=1 Tax=Evansella sp. AB-rgal1 TaxID=3242696 RepID=UPI00359D8489
MRKFILAFLLIRIAVFSATPYLVVHDVSTWFHPPEYHTFSLVSLFHYQSDFYTFYPFEKNLEEILQLAGHLVSYSSLSVSFFLTFKKIPIHRRFMITWGFSSFVGLLDEWNQFFIVGRDGRLVDFLLHSFSSFITLLLILAFIYLKGQMLTYFKDKKSPDVNTNL